MEKSLFPKEHNEKHHVSSIHKAAAQQIKKDKSKIKAAWEMKVRNKIPAAEGQTSPALLNSMEIFLDELCDSLEKSTLNSNFRLGEHGMSRLHGEQRAQLTGYFLPQLFQEFSILRAVITEDLHKTGLLSYEVGAIINEAVDAAISLAATEFADVHQIRLKRALEKAEASNLDLEHFAAIAAHDLKSPLATISSYLDLLTEETKDVLGEEPLKYINVMQKASERMRRLIDRLLYYARLTKPEKPFQPVDLNEILSHVLQNLHESITKTHAKILIPVLPTVSGDAHLLTQLFQNLIANSIKFHGASPPHIQIEFKRQDHTYLFSLQDRGIGFNPKDKENIFTLYKKLQDASDTPGAGIGLATCRKVIELHGGQIWAESQPGKGSTFHFTLPQPEIEQK